MTTLLKNALSKTFLAAGLGMLLSTVCVAQNNNCTPSTTNLMMTFGQLPSAAIGTPYLAPLTATGGTPPYAWSAATLNSFDTGLPPGLVIDPTGAIRGTPLPSAVTRNVSLTVADSASFIVQNELTHDSCTQLFPLIVNPSLYITTTSLPAGALGVVYNQTLGISGATPPVTWSATGLPNGLALNPSTGAITGSPLSAGTFSLGVSVTDSSNQTATRTLSLVIGQAGPTILTSTLFNGTVGTPYTTTLMASGGITPYTWSATGVPAGLTLTAAGVLSGTPTAPGTSAISVTLTDSSTPPQTAKATLSLLINPSTLFITTTSLPPGSVGAVYNQTLNQLGGTAPYTWTATGVPAGLSLSAAGVLSGTPAVVGSFTLAVTLTDSSSPKQTATANVALVINSRTLSITTTSLPAGNVGTPYNQTLALNGGTSPYTWTASGIPAGLTLSAAGVLSGTPTAVGAFTLSVTVTDSSNPKQTATSSVSLVINTATLSITTLTLPNGTVGAIYNQTLNEVGGTAPYTWSATGTPAGLSLSAAGVLSGTPTTVGSFTLSVTLTDSSNPKQTATANVPIIINLPGLSITTTTLPAGTVGVAYNQTLTLSGGTAPFTWTTQLSPPGMTLSAAGVLSGTPTTAGAFTIPVALTDSSTPKQTATANLSLVINAPTLSITTTTLPNGTLGTAYNQALALSGGTAPFTWTATGVPAGSTLSAAGVLSGTPTALGAFTLAVTLTDGSNPKQTASASLSLVINQATLSITTTSLPNGTAGVAYSQTLTSSGGTSPFTWSAIGTPAGLSLSAAGLLSGTPTASGPFSLSVTLTDSSNPKQTATRTLSLTLAQPVAPSLQITPSVTQVTSIVGGASVTVGLNTPVPADLTATLALSFTPNSTGLPSPYTNPTLMFMQGAATTNLTITQGSTSATLPTNNLIQVGSVAGTVTVTLTSLTETVSGQPVSFALPSPPPATNIGVPKLVPSIMTVKIINVTSTGFTVDIVANSTPRDLSSAGLTFTASSGDQLNGTTNTTVSIASPATTWFGSTNVPGLTAGGAFDLQIPFNFSGSTSALGSVTVTLTNSVGTSTSVTGTM